MNLVFSLGQEIPTVTEAWKIWLSQYIIFNYLNNFLPLGVKVNFVNELRSTKNQVPKHF